MARATGGGKGIADLTVRGGLPACKFPISGKTLQAGNHGDGEARYSDKITAGRLIRDAHAINSKSFPGPPGTGRAEIWASVFEGATHDSGGNVIRSPLPGTHASPATFRP